MREFYFDLQHVDELRRRAVAVHDGSPLAYLRAAILSHDLSESWIISKDPRVVSVGEDVLLCEEDVANWEWYEEPSDDWRISVTLDGCLFGGVPRVSFYSFCAPEKSIMRHDAFFDEGGIIRAVTPVGRERA